MLCTLPGKARLGDAPCLRLWILICLLVGSGVAGCGGRSAIGGDEGGPLPETPCEDDGDCEGGQTCVGDVCRASCGDEDDCPASAPYCSERNEVCVACLHERHCQEGWSCDRGTCVSPECEEGDERCAGNTIEMCWEGTWTPNAVCGSGYLCADDGTDLYCEEVDRSCEIAESYCIDDATLAICNAEGTGFEAIYCPDFGFVCVDGACVTRTCQPGQLFCGDGDVRLCSMDGQSSSLWDICDFGEQCIATDPPTCSALFCNPGEIGCDGNVAYQCDEKGSGYLYRENCGSGLCKEGACYPIVCDPGTYSCGEQGDVVLCSFDGTSMTIADNCSATEYCVPGQATCRPQVCVPGASWCAANNLVTCNEQGSGSSVESCLPGECVAGACENELFYEGFEDGSANDWTHQGNGYSMAIVGDQAADGTFFSLWMSGGNGNHYDGIYRDLLPPIQPSHFSYYALPLAQEHGTYLTLHSSTTAPSLGNEVAFVYFRADGFITVGGQGNSIIAGSYEPGNWYFIELEFDWLNDTYDISIDGDVALEGVAFRGGDENAIARISLYHFGSTEGYWDELRAY